MICDSGLAAHLVGMSRATFISGRDAKPGPGNLFETFVLTELMKASHWAESDPRIFHWRDRLGREVDLLLERRDGDVVAFEVKLGGTPSSGDFAHLAYLRDQLGTRFRCGVVICPCATTSSFGDRLWAVPVDALWSAPDHAPSAALRDQSSRDVRPYWSGIVPPAPDGHRPLGRGRTVFGDRIGPAGQHPATVTPVVALHRLP